MLQIVASLTEDSWGVIYDCNIFYIHGTEIGFIRLVQEENHLFANLNLFSILIDKYLKRLVLSKK